MKLTTKLALRAFFSLVVVSSAGFLTYAAATGPSGNTPVEQPTVDGEYDGTTAITVHGDTKKSSIVVYSPDGSVQYVNSTYDRYFDVDPHPSREDTVVYTAAMHAYGPPCKAGGQCSYSVIEQLNLTTGETQVLFKRYRPNIHNSRWHDADRIDEHRWIVADIAFDRVFVVNTTTGMSEWSWNAQNHFGMSTGNAYPDDWTHINDVEVLDDGHIMVSVRNQDRVVFLDPEKGVVKDRTLGVEDNYDILHEQHNPDYINEEHGGPAVLVADSHNNRIVEYQRSNDRWVQSWTWTDTRLQWPRDADRLPNGNTLVTDSSGNRVLEIDQNGKILWSVAVDTPYDAERLETGDESANGRSAHSLGLQSRTVDESDVRGSRSGRPLGLSVLLFVRNLFPPLILNAVLYVLPPWVHFTELAAIGALGFGVLGWSYAEYRWSSITVTFAWPLRINR
jgi:hypothetical protein